MLEGAPSGDGTDGRKPGVLYESLSCGAIMEERRKTCELIARAQSRIPETDTEALDALRGLRGRLECRPEAESTE